MASPLTQHRARIGLVVLVLVHLAVISRQVDGGGGQSLLTQLLLTTLSPVQRLVALVGRGAGSLFTGYVDLRGARDEARALEGRVQVLETRLLEREQLAREAESLRAMLGLRTTLEMQSVVAGIIGRDGFPWARTITLDKGRREGVALDAPVLSPSGIVGRVIALGPHVARVQLLVDRTAGAGVIVERTRTPGVLGGPAVATGADAPEIALSYVPALADVVEGDTLVTSGTDGIYPKGLPAGVVRSVRSASLFKDVVVTPAVRPESLEFVLVLVGSVAGAPAFDESVR